ncbi:MAG: hypothetical protein JXR96_19180 [Deltaproteobacteria bacterium]|nr:hypothetical protein [Deltaproteobacteria bacterium]
MERAVALWARFAVERQPRIRKPSVYAAAVEYSLTLLESGYGPSQDELAERYGVSASSISRVHGEIVEMVASGERAPPSLAELVDRLAAEELESEQERAERALARVQEEMREEQEAPFEATAATREALRALPRTNELWLGGRRAIHTVISRDGPFQPDAVVWLEAGSRAITTGQLVHPDDDDLAVIEALAAAMLEPAFGQPRRPATVELDDPRLARRFKPVFDSLQMACQLGSGDLIDEAVAALESQLQDAYPEPGLLGKGIEPDVLAEFHRVAARLARSDAWRALTEQLILEVDPGIPGVSPQCVCMLGAPGPDRGLLFFASADDYFQHARLAELRELGARACRPGVELLALGYDPVHTLGKARQRELMEHGWELADTDSAPGLIKMGPDDFSLPLSADDYRIASRCADAIGNLLDAHPEAFEAPGARRRFTLDDRWIVIPHPAMPLWSRGC